MTENLILNERFVDTMGKIEAKQREDRYFLSHFLYKANVRITPIMEWK